MSHPELDPDEHWREPSENIEPGDVFARIPLLTLRPDPAILDEGQIFLPTRVAPFALLLKILHACWWFVPVLTQEVIGDEGLFNDLVDECNRSERPGWFPLVPLDGYPPLAGFSLVLTLQPTLHRPAAFDDAHAWRVASLTPGAFDDVCKTFLDGFAST